jgi:dihydroorotase
MQLILRHGRVIDPSQEYDRIADLGIEDGRIAEIAPHISTKGCVEIDARGLIVAPGFMDMHVHLREPGREDAETIESGTRAAARGGFTAVACMPNTKPVNDSEAVTSRILARAREVSKIPVYPIGAITQGSRGEALAEIAEMVRAGIVAISDDGHPVQNSRMMRRAMEEARLFDIPVIDHCEDKDLAAGGCMNEGHCSTQLGLPGMDPAAEELQVVRDAILARKTGARVHIAHISTRKSLEAVVRAKREGIPITCEVTPHHLLLTEECVAAYDTNAKMNPPLRTEEDVEALVAGLATGAIDAIATDHAPHSMQDKLLDFSRAPFGIVGLETAVGLMLDRLVRPGTLSLNRMIEALTTSPARILKLERGTLRKGAPADLTVLDPELQWEVHGSEFLSRSRNTPFEGWQLRGGPAMTLVRGTVVWSRH